MQFRGNKILFFQLELLSGLVIFVASLLWGDFGLAGLGIFFIGMFLTMSTPDEREMVLLYKATALEGAALGAIMAIIYMFFKDYNWFHGYVSLGLITRGVIGWFSFARE